LFPEADSRARAATFGCQLRNCRHRNPIDEDTCGFHAISPSHLTRLPTLCHLLPAIYHNLHSPSPPIQHRTMGHSQSKTSARSSKHHPQQTNSLQPFTYTPLAGPRNFRILHLARRRGEASVNHEDLELHASLVLHMGRSGASRQDLHQRTRAGHNAKLRGCVATNAEGQGRETDLGGLDMYQSRRYVCVCRVILS
jgi:hypothetical protein